MLRHVVDSMSLRMLILICTLLAHALSETGSCETSLLQTAHLHSQSSQSSQSQAQSPKTPKSSCLSFIHIPKTGGGTIEAARVKTAGTEWNATPRNISPDNRCFQKVREKRLSGLSGKSEDRSDDRDDSDSGNTFGAFRFWGACDDQIQCSSGNETSLMCSFQTHAGAQGRCSRWHVPPGLDFTVAASYTRNPFYKSTESQHSEPEHSGKTSLQPENSFASLSACDTFCVVRDPMQRLLSALNWDISFFLNDSYCNPEYFEEWARLRLTYLNTGGDCHYLPQVYYVFENGDYKHGRQICRHVIKTDDLPTAFPSLMKQYDLDVELADQHMHSGKCDLQPTPTTVELVKTFYAGDYSAFGF